MQATSSFILVLLFACAVFGQPPPDEPFPCPIVDCAVDGTPCLVNPCAQYTIGGGCPGVTCCSNFCGGCFADLYNATGHRVEIGENCQDDPCANVRCAEPLCEPGYAPVRIGCCSVCRLERVQLCPAPNLAFPTDLACPEPCDSDSECTEDGELCCLALTCDHKICTRSIMSTCFDPELLEPIPVGVYQRDNCHECECHTNGTISCKETCVVMTCPQEAPSGVGICVMQCSADNPCPNDRETCCVNECGGGVCRTLDIMCRSDDGEFVAAGDTFERDCNTCTCQDDGTVNCTEEFCPSYGCPATTDDSTAVSCSIGFDDSCAGNPDARCGEDSLCCNVTVGCAPACVQPVIVCPLNYNKVLQIGETISRPESCETCTCGDDGQLNCDVIQGCQICMQNGVIYMEGDEVPSLDTCNTCTCNGGSIACTEIGCPPVACYGPDGTPYAAGDTFENDCNTCTCTDNGPLCTLIFCVDPCFQEPAVVGDCDAAFPRWSYHQETRSCSNFTYGGCEGNDNNFETQRDCLEACSPRRSCLAAIYENEPICLIAPVERWTYNIDTDDCERFNYSPCEGFGSDNGLNVYLTEEICERTCIEDDPECPEDVPINCFADPCQYPVCPNFPDAECRSNSCGGCNAWYFSEGENVTEKCFSDPSCDDGSSLVNCFIDPCEVSRCPEYPEARCQPNYCGGCNAEFFDEDGNDVTDSCREGRPTAMQFLQCPALAQDTIGTCVSECSSNRDCEDGQACCSNGCGQTCQQAVIVPYYEIPTTCPENPTIGICLFDENVNCLEDNECVEGQLCCPSGCGSVCSNATRSREPCIDLFDRLFQYIDASLVGVFVPQCTDDGLFAPVQSHGSTGNSWCVNVYTGLPISAVAGPGSIPSCTTCMENGVVYYPGQSYPTSDGCNTCTCTDSGVSACTRRACVNPCELPPDSGPCRGAFPAYYHDASDGSCKRFTYGGCEGNDNKFPTIAQCLRKCQPESDCLKSPESDVCIPELVVQRYVFNTTSNRCEQYGPACPGENSFDSGDECLRGCDPDGDYDRCVLMECNIPECDPGEVFVPDDSCCGGVCSELECDDDEVLCRDGSRCIDTDQICDILTDCDDGSDEMDCDTLPSCEGRFSCQTSQECIPYDYRCDNYVDCRDSSDERNCSNTNPNEFPPNTQFISDVPLECPPAGFTGLCSSEEDSCSSSRDCSDDAAGVLCCPTSCGTQQCVTGVPPTDLCAVLRRGLLATMTTPLLGAFVPECDRNGMFESVQCHEGYCWCVEIQTGYPLTEGLRPSDDGDLQCGCEINGNTLSFGESYPHLDGCNSCLCTPGYPDTTVCTNDRCPVACVFSGIEIAHTDSYEDECSQCVCMFGSMNCERRDCPAGTAAIRDPARVRMAFNGDFDAIKDKMEDFERECIRTMLSLYGDSLNLQQHQVTDVEVSRGSVIVVFVLADSESTNMANLTILLSQVEQDFNNGVFDIRFGNTVLQPMGQFIIVQESAISQPWVIAVIVIAGVLAIIAIVAIVIAVVACVKARNRGSGPEYSGKASSNDYNYPVSFKPSTEEVKVPLD